MCLYDRGFRSCNALNVLTIQILKDYCHKFPFSITSTVIRSDMSNESIKKAKKRTLSQEELLNLSKEELIERIRRLECHNLQLKNIISKQNEEISTGYNKSARKFDFTKCKWRHILLRVMYLGWHYQGFASQEDTIQTIEHHLFSALIKCCLVEKRETSNYHRCGRTDKGVSSFGQVISLDIRSVLAREDEKQQTEGELPYTKLLNRVLPPEIRVLGWSPAPSQEFSARFNCSSRTYKYWFPRGNLKLEAMSEGLKHLIGKHDFRNLCKMDVANGVVNFERNILSASIDIAFKDPNNSEYDILVLTLTGQAFLWHQVRCIMAILLLIGSGKEAPDVIQQLLDVQTFPRKPQYSLASEIPLNLFHCEYADLDEKWIMDEDALEGVIRTLQTAWTISSAKTAMIRTALQACEAMLPSGVKLTEQVECLLQGVKPKVYQPLLQRPTCESLEKRIEHYTKKQRLTEVPRDETKEESEVLQT